jgi:hypothetical protein
MQNGSVIAAGLRCQPGKISDTDNFLDISPTPAGTRMS